MWRDPAKQKEWYDANRQKLRDYHRAYARKWRKTPQAKLSVPLSNQKQNLKRCFGISVEDYNLLLARQNGVCAICKKTDKCGRRLAVDHEDLKEKRRDHHRNVFIPENTKIRGLLCIRCNNAIGALKHDKELLLAAIKYLEESDSARI